MSKIRICDGCQFLNKKKKTSPCNKGLLVSYDINQKIFIRPNKCKTKEKKQNPKKEFIKLKEQVIDLFQMYIRYRDSWKCCCCGFFIDPKEKDAKKLMHAGHFISRKFENLLLDENNCHAQCRTCNGLQDWLGINPKYIIYLFKKYGIEIFEYLSKKQSEKKKHTIEEWQQLKKYWQNKLNKEIKNFNDRNK